MSGSKVASWSAVLKLGELSACSSFGMSLPTLTLSAVADCASSTCVTVVTPARVMLIARPALPVSLPLAGASAPATMASRKPTVAAACGALNPSWARPPALPVPAATWKAVTVGSSAIRRMRPSRPSARITPSSPASASALLTSVTRAFAPSTWSSPSSISRLSASMSPKVSTLSRAPLTKGISKFEKKSLFCSSSSEVASCPSRLTKLAASRLSKLRMSLNPAGVCTVRVAGSSRSASATDRVVAGEAVMPMNGAASGNANWAAPSRLAVTRSPGDARLSMSSRRSMRPSSALEPGSVIWMLTTGDALTLPSTICTPRNPKRARASMLFAARVSCPVAAVLRMKKASRTSAPPIRSPRSRPKSRWKSTMASSWASALKLSSARPSSRSKPKSMGVATETSSCVKCRP